MDAEDFRKTFRLTAEAFDYVHCKLYERLSPKREDDRNRSAKEKVCTNCLFA